MIPFSVFKSIDKIIIIPNNNYIKIKLKEIAMKLEIIAQAGGKEMNLTDLEKTVKEQIKAAGLKITKVENATAYVNIDEGKTYVVVETEGEVKELA